MSVIHNKIEYDCQCHSYCDQKTYIRTEEDGSGITTIFFNDHVNGENSVSLNSTDVDHLRLLLSKIK